MKDVEARFGDIDPEYTAREKLKKLRQGSSVERYNTDFKKVQAQSGYSETDLMEKYQDGLNKETLQKIYKNHLPTTLKGWMSEALRFKRLTHRLKARKAGGRSYAPPSDTFRNNQPEHRTGAEYKPGTT